MTRALIVAVSGAEAPRSDRSSCVRRRAWQAGQQQNRTTTAFVNGSGKRWNDTARRAEHKAGETFTVGSRNVFADLGFEDAEERLIKADLAIHIKSEIRRRGLSQAQVGRLTGLTQSEVSRIGSIKTDGFSQERLQNVLRKLGIDVEIRLRHRDDGPAGTLRVSESA